MYKAMATPEARSLARQFPALTLGYSPELCGQAAVNFIQALVVSQRKRDILDLAHRWGVALPPEIRQPYSIVIPDEIVCDEHTSIPGCLSLEKRSSGLPAGLVIEGIHAGLIYSFDPNGRPQASHYWNEDRWRSAPSWASCPVNKDGGVVFTSIPHCFDFHHACCKKMEEWYDELTHRYRTTSEALLDLMEREGIPRPEKFNKVIAGCIY